MLHLHDLPTLRYHRDKTMIIFLYKIIHKLVDIKLQHHISLRPISRDTCGPLCNTYNYLPASMHINTPISHQQLNSGTICQHT